MIALPLGTVLCFFDLLGARAFSRGEVSLISINTHLHDDTYGRLVACIAIHFSWPVGVRSALSASADIYPSASAYGV
jgi:hypothetical protein